MNLNDRHIIVTGAGAGIGLGVVRQCLAAGARVSGFDNNAATKAKLEALGVSFTLVDVGDMDAFEQAIINAHQAVGRLDGLVNNAGVTIQVPFLDMSREQLETLWRVNHRSVLLGCQCAGRIMAKAGAGAIVNIASNHARCTNPGFEAYAGTKGAIVSMTRAMAWSLGPFKIRVNALCPGLARTEVVELAMENPDNERNFRSWSADQEVSTVEQIGNACVFLLSDAAAAFNGSELVADRAMSSLLGVMDIRRN